MLLFHLKQSPWNIDFVLVINDAYHQTSRRAAEINLEADLVEEHSKNGAVIYQQTFAAKIFPKRHNWGFKTFLAGKTNNCKCLLM